MQSQHWIGLFLIFGLATFAIWDVYLFLAGKTTLSRYVIEKSKKSRVWAYMALIFAISITCLGIWLFFHLELNCILFNFECWIDI